MSDRPRLLPLLGATRHGSRDAMTCLYRCGNACDHPVPNTSDNTYFGDLVEGEVSRRGVVRAGAVGALVLGFGSTAAGALAGAAPAAAAPATPVVPEVADPTAPQRGVGSGALTFKPIPPNQLDTLVVPNGYDHARGHPLGRPGAARRAPLRPARADRRRAGQAVRLQQRLRRLLPLDRRDRGRCSVVNHEYTNEDMMFPGFTSRRRRHRRAGADRDGRARPVRGRAGAGATAPASGAVRRPPAATTGGSPPDTEFELTGPAAGSTCCKTAADPKGRTVLGTLNNCAGGTTPWGTVLSGEENFNQYFVAATRCPPAQAPYTPATASPPPPAPAAAASGSALDERFDLAKHPNEANRFGWIVEVDPFDPTSTPRKHTALGRFKHEGANVIVARDGRVVGVHGRRRALRLPLQVRLARRPCRATRGTTGSTT